MFWFLADPYLVVYMLENHDLMFVVNEETGIREALAESLTYYPSLDVFAEELWSSDCPTEAFAEAQCYFGPLHSLSSVAGW